MNRKKNIYIMYAIVLLQGMVFYSPIATLYRQAHGLTVFQITAIESISYVLCILFEIPWGFLADKIGYKRTMCVCCGLFFVSKIIFWKASGFTGFLLERILLSVVISGLSGVDTSVLYLSCAEGESQKVFGIYNSLGLAGLLSAAFLFSAFIGTNYSLAAFMTMLSYGIAAILPLFLEEVKSEDSQPISLAELKKVFLRLLRDKQFVLFLISVAFLTETHQTIAVFLNQVQYERCGISASMIGYIYILVTVVGLVGAFSDKVTHKLGVKATGLVLYASAGILCIVLGFTGQAMLSVSCILLLNVIDSIYQPYQAEFQNKQVQSANRATELSVYAMVVNCVSAGTSVMYGALADHSLSMAFFFGTAVCTAGLIFFRSWYAQKGETA